MATQLRDYTIASGRLDDFVAAWAAGVRPLRERFGFRVIGAWAAPEHDGFVWIVAFPGSIEEFAARDAVYYASPERRDLSPDPAQWIVDQRTAFVEPVGA